MLASERVHYRACSSTLETNGKTTCSHNQLISLQKQCKQVTVGPLVRRQIVRFQGNQMKISVTTAPPDGSNKQWNVHFYLYYCMEERSFLPHAVFILLKGDLLRVVNTFQVCVSRIK